MSSDNVSFCVDSEFNPELITMNPPVKSKKTTNGYNDHYVKFNGKSLIAKIPSRTTSAIIWKENKEKGYKTAHVIAQWSADDKMILRGFDKLYLRLFKLVSPFGAAAKKSLMLTLANAVTSVEMMDMPNNILNNGKTFRDDMYDCMNPFYNHPYFKEEDGDKNVRDKSKPLATWFTVRKATSTNEYNAGSDNYDCKFKMPFIENGNAVWKPVPWSSVTGGSLTHEMLVNVTGIRRTADKLSIKFTVFNSHITNYEKNAMSPSGDIETESAKNTLANLTPEQFQAFQKFMEAMNTAPSPMATQPTMPPQLTQPPTMPPPQMAPQVTTDTIPTQTVTQTVATPQPVVTPQITQPEEKKEEPKVATTPAAGGMDMNAMMAMMGNGAGFNMTNEQMQMLMATMNK